MTAREARTKSAVKTGIVNLKSGIGIMLVCCAFGVASVNAAPKQDPATPAGTSKPTAPIAISHRFASPPQVGQPVEVILSISAPNGVTRANVLLSADDPLAMIDPIDGRIDGRGLASLSAGQGTDVAVTVLPLLDRTHYLNVTVSAVIDGVEQTRSVAVPIRLPGSELQKALVEPAGNGEERVRSFEAIETVR
jgi:hypothetical protein